MKVVLACTASKNLEMLNTIPKPKTVLVSYHYIKGVGGAEALRQLKSKEETNGPPRAPSNP